jgi:flagellin
MNVQLNGNQTAQKNVQNANALLSTVEGNLNVVEDNVSRIRDLTLQAKNGTYSSSEIKAMQDEVDQRVEEINRISKSFFLTKICHVH